MGRDPEENSYEEFLAYLRNTTLGGRDNRQAASFFKVGTDLLIGEMAVPAWQLAAVVSGCVGVAHASSVSRINGQTPRRLAATLLELRQNNKLPLVADPKRTDAATFLDQLLESKPGRAVYQQIALFLQRGLSEQGLRIWLYKPDGASVPTMEDGNDSATESSSDEEEGSDGDTTDLVDLLDGKRHKNKEKTA